MDRSDSESSRVLTHYYSNVGTLSCLHMLDFALQQIALLFPTLKSSKIILKAIFSIKFGCSLFYED